MASTPRQQPVPINNRFNRPLADCVCKGSTVQQQSPFMACACQRSVQALPSSLGSQSNSGPSTEGGCGVAAVRHRQRYWPLSAEASVPALLLAHNPLSRDLSWSPSHSSHKAVHARLRFATLCVVCHVPSALGGRSEAAPTLAGLCP
jgi:cytochrome c553